MIGCVATCWFPIILCQKRKMWLTWSLTGLRHNILYTRSVYTTVECLLFFLFFFDVWAAVNEGVVMFTMDILLSGWCLASHYLCTCVAAGGLSWFTCSLLWQYFCMETVLNAVFIGIFLFSWEIFSLISLKGKKKHFWLPVWWLCAKLEVSSAVFFYSCLKRIFFLPVIWFVKLTLCLNHNFNPPPYVLMPSWRVWFVPVVQ